MKFPSPIPARKARLEIIPLIDIMFFLLAAFVLVSLTMVKQLTIKVDLPAVAAAEREKTREPIAIGVDARGNVFLGEEPLSLPDLRERVQSRLAAEPDASVTISGDANTTHGAMVGVLEFVRSCGVERVAFAVKTRDTPPPAPEN